MRELTIVGVVLCFVFFQPVKLARIKRCGGDSWEYGPTTDYPVPLPESVTYEPNPLPEPLDPWQVESQTTEDWTDWSTNEWDNNNWNTDGWEDDNWPTEDWDNNNWSTERWPDWDNNNWSTESWEEDGPEEWTTEDNGWTDDWDNWSTDDWDNGRTEVYPHTKPEELFTTPERQDGATYPEHGRPTPVWWGNEALG